MSANAKIKWNRRLAIRSVALFFLNLVILLAITCILILGDNLGRIGLAIKENSSNYLYLLFFIFLCVCITYFYYFFENKKVLTEPGTVMLIFTILDVSLIISCVFGKWVNVYSRPVALVALLTFMLIGRRDAIFMNTMYAVIMFVLDSLVGLGTEGRNMYSSFIIAFTAGMLSIYTANRVKTRLQVIFVGLFIALPSAIIIGLLEIANVASGVSTIDVLSTDKAMDIFSQVGYGALGGIFSASIFIVILPLFEFTFNCLTVFRLRELCSSDAPLIKRLKESAPGTYTHSMTVAQLAETCAEAIGENPDMARAAALYHDVGKMHQAEYFTENQDDYNPHDELTPELSADIIRSHTQSGYELILAHHLPQFLADVALQHHGSMPIRFFYARALKMTGGDIDIEDFSYMGPKPQNKIAAIIMIADASEAATKALKDRTPEATEKVIRGIIEERMDLDQFGDCDITMKDLTVIRLALVDALTGVYHHRVEYPPIRYTHTEDGKTKGENV